MLYAYAQFAGACFEPNNGWPCQSCGQAGFPTDWERRDGKWGTWDDSKGLPNSSPWNWFATAVGLWKPPGSPASFFDALNKDVNTLNVALQAAGHSTNAVGLLAGWNGTCDNVPAVVQFQRSRFDPSSWTDSGNFVKALLATGLWQDQSGVLTDLLAPPVLTADTYFFLLHLLLALATSTSKDRQRVQQLLNATVTSSEYPNDTFINQLVYLVLMHLADPAGPFGWTNEQLLEELDLLGGVVTGTDPGAQAIQASLSSHRRVVQSDASYPMQDPYCPSIGFTVRKTDTLRALDATRQATKSQNGGPSLA